MKISELDTPALVAVGYNEAIIGFSMNEERFVYSVTKMLELIETNLQISDVEALEFFEFNIQGAYMGEHTPIWCWDNFET